MEEATMQNAVCVDVAPLDDLERDLGVDAAVEIVMSFLGELPGRVDAVLDDDPENARRAAHALKSSAALVGAQQLSSLAQSVEAGAAPTSELRELADRVAAVLRGWVVGKVR